MNESTWVSVKHKLPDKGIKVLIVYQETKSEYGIRFGYITFDGHWRPEGGNGNFDKYITHWMPLPELPRKVLPLP